MCAINYFKLTFTDVCTIKKMFSWGYNLGNYSNYFNHKCIYGVNEYKNIITNFKYCLNITVNVAICAGGLFRQQWVGGQWSGDASGKNSHQELWYHLIPQRLPWYESLRHGHHGALDLEVRDTRHAGHTPCKLSQH